MATRQIPAPIAPLLCRLRDDLARSFGSRFEGLRLYGSWARGEQDAESDVDVAVLVSGRATRDDQREGIRLGTEVGLAGNVLFSVSVFGADDFRRLVEREHPFYEAVDREGIPL